MGEGGLLLIIVLAWSTASQAGQVDAYNQRVDVAYPKYQRLYAGLDPADPKRVVLAEAKRRVEAAQINQETIRRVLENELLTALDGKVENSQRVGASGAALFSYHQVVDEVDSRYRSLRSKASRLSIPNMPSLPHEGADKLIRGNEPEQLLLRSWQLAEVFLVHQVVDEFFNLGIHQLTSIEVVPPFADGTVDPSYVSLGLRLSVSIDLVNVDRLLTYLRDTQDGLDLEALSMSADSSIEGRFTMDVTIRQTSTWPERWDPNVVLEGAAGGGLQPATNLRSTTRGRAQ